MKNIIIVTFINSYNYGAFLQAKATEMIISKTGLKPRFLNYCNKEEQNQRKLFCYSAKFSVLYNLKRFAWKLWFGYYHGEIRNGKKNFQGAIDNLPKTKKYNRLSDIEKNERIDLLICGSDQIWNPDIFNAKIDPIYYGKIKNAKSKISFASSFGSYEPNKQQLETLKDYFCDFDAISVREGFAKKNLKKIGVEMPIDIVLDPTLCITAKEWRVVSKNNDKFNIIQKNAYMVIYLVNPKVKCQGLIDYVSKVLNLKTIWIKNNDLKSFQVDEIVTNATPYDFVNLISNAKFVLTDSFHGTAFAINLNIDFVSIINQNNPERVMHLCTELGLLDRLSKEDDAECNVTIIDYTCINEKLSELREKSIQWILNRVERY